MKQCSNCGATWDDVVTTCENCGTALEEAAVPVPAEQPMETPKKKTGLLVSLITAAVLIVGVVVTGFLTDWFGLVGNTDADKDTGTDASANTDPVDDTQTGDTPPSLTAMFEALSDIDNVTVTATADIRTSDPIQSEMSTVTVRFVTDDAGKTIMLSQRDQTSVLTLDGVEYTLEDDYADKLESEKIGGELLETLKGKLFAEDFDAKSFAATLYQEYLADEEWLTAFMGYTKDGEVYTFEPDLYKLYKEFVRILEKHKVFTQESIDYLKTDLDSWDEPEAGAATERIKLVFTAKNNALVKMQLVIATDEIFHDYVMEFTDVGTTVITESEIETIKNTVDEWVANDTCPECGDRLYGEELCWYCDEEAGYDYCENCGVYGDVIWCDDYYICEECMEKYSVCDKCGALAETQYNDGYDLCDECNSSYGG